jgi:hypothetical protein
MEVVNPPLIIIPSHEKIRIPSGVSSFDLITNLLCHQKIKITRKPKVMQNSIIFCMIDQQSGTMCHEVYC